MLLKVKISNKIPNHSIAYEFRLTEDTDDYHADMCLFPLVLARNFLEMNADAV